MENDRPFVIVVQPHATMPGKFYAECPSFERTGWVGDTVEEARAAAENGLRETVAHQRDSGEDWLRPSAEVFYFDPESTLPACGQIAWVDVSVPDAAGLKNFYCDVVGWGAESVGMGDYDDYALSPSGSSAAVAGVCHARGFNADMPAAWLIYVTVRDLKRSIARCLDGGGRVVVAPRTMGGAGSVVVIEDPAGAVVALVEATPGREHAG